MAWSFIDCRPCLPWTFRCQGQLHSPGMAWLNSDLSGPNAVWTRACSLGGARTGRSCHGCSKRLDRGGLGRAFSCPDTRQTRLWGQSGQPEVDGSPSEALRGLFSFLLVYPPLTVSLDLPLGASGQGQPDCWNTSVVIVIQGEEFLPIDECGIACAVSNASNITSCCEKSCSSLEPAAFQSR